MEFSPEVEGWLKDLALTTEERAVLEPVLGKPERLEKVKGSVLRQSEFSKKMQALDNQKTALEASIAEKERLVADDAAALGTWKKTADESISITAKALEEERVKSYRLQEKMKTLATQYGADPKEWGVDGELKPPETKIVSPDTTAFDQRYLGRPDADRLLQEVKSSPFIAAELEDIVDEHRSLFNRGVNRKELVTNALKNKRTLREEWETANEVTKRREELAEKKVNDRIEARVSEERTKILSEHKLPVSRGANDGSPILAMRDDLKLAGTDRSKASGAGAVDAAVATYNTGKYRGAPAIEKTT
jgi:hypothetical protein